MQGALKQGPCTCTTFRVFNLTYLHILHSQRYFDLERTQVRAHTYSSGLFHLCTYLYIYSQVHIPRSVLVCEHTQVRECTIELYIYDNIPMYLLALHVHGPHFTTPDYYIHLETKNSELLLFQNYKPQLPLPSFYQTFILNIKISREKKGIK